MVFMQAQPDVSLLQKFNHSKFTEEEDIALESIVSQNKTKNWKFVAEQLGNRHTPRQCKERWMCLYKESHIWTQEENKKLVKLVRDYHCGWDIIAIFFENCTPHEVRHHWAQLAKKPLENGILKPIVR